METKPVSRGTVSYMVRGVVYRFHHEALSAYDGQRVLVQWNPDKPAEAKA